MWVGGGESDVGGEGDGCGVLVVVGVGDVVLGVVEWGGGGGCGGGGVGGGGEGSGGGGAEGRRRGGGV